MENIRAVCVGLTRFCAAFWSKNAKTVAKTAVITSACKITELNSNEASERLQKNEKSATVPIWMVVIRKVSMAGAYFPTRIMCIAKEKAQRRMGISRCTVQ